jgi:urease accessory protein
MFFSEEKNQKTFASFAGPSAKLQRANGALQIGVANNKLTGLYQQGCLKARFPRTHDATMEAVLINTSGGVTDGDQLDIAIDAGENTRLVVSTPSAEKIYRALPGQPPAQIRVSATIAATARLDYLPQETLLFENSALDRTLQIDMHGQAQFLAVEALLFGRSLHGETLANLQLRDTLRIRRDGRLILQDGVRLQGAVHTKLAARAAAGTARATATIILVAPEAEARLDAVRAARTGAEAGASAWNGMLLARLLAEDGQALRRLIVRVLQPLRENTLPRLWAS